MKKKDILIKYNCLKELSFLFFLLFVSCILKAQNVGIGTISPVAKLEVVGAGNNSLTNNLLLKRLDGDTLFRLRNDGKIGIGYNGITFGRTVNIGGNGVNFYKTDEDFGGSIFPTDTSLVIWSNTNANNYVIIQPSWGNLGIGTFRPLAKLHVNGDMILGASGTVITGVIKRSVLKNINTIPANTVVTETFAVAGADTTATVHISPDLVLPDGIIICYARVSAADTVEVKFINCTAASINPASMRFHITVIN